MSEESVNISGIGLSGRVGVGGNRRVLMAFLIVSSLLAIGAFVPCLVNVLLVGKLDWSLYSWGAILMTWLILMPWFLLARYRAAISWVMAVLTVPAYLFWVENLTATGGEVLRLGLPAAVCGLAALGGIIWAWCYSRMKSGYAFALTFLILGVLSWLENMVARPFLFPDPYEAIRSMVTFSLLGMFVLSGLAAFLVYGRRVQKP